MIREKIINFIYYSPLSAPIIKTRHQILVLKNKQNQKLLFAKNHQKKEFSDLSKDFKKIYQKLKRYNIDKSTLPHWKNYNNQLESTLLPTPPFNFLNNFIIVTTMFNSVGGEWLTKELTYLEKKIPKNKLSELLMEDLVGEPLILNKKYATSHNTINHLYHLIKYINETKINIDKVNTIIEWGGGYGNLAKLFFRYTKKPKTYIIIDTPLFSSLQWLYLSAILGRENVNILLNKKDKISPNKINIVTFGIAQEKVLKGDLFISTWAISESSDYSQKFVLKKDWFEAKHLLLTYQFSNKQLPYASQVGTMAKEKGAKILPITYLPGNHYAFL